MATKILDVDGAKPQFLMTNFSDGNTRKFMMVYTGVLDVGHGAADDFTSLTIEYPLLAWDTDSSGNDTIAIYHFHDPDILDSAVASAALSLVQIKDTIGTALIHTIRADIKKVGIRRLEQGIEITEVINALVLSLTAGSMESLVGEVNYNVTVIGKLEGERHWEPIPLSDPNKWLGRYEVVVNPPVKRGNPRK